MELEEMIRKLTSAASSNLVVHDPLEHVPTKAVDAFKAKHPGHGIDDTLLGSSETNKLEELFALDKQQLMTLFSAQDEAGLAESLAVLQMSNDEKVKAFGTAYLQELMNQWVNNGEEPVQVLAKLKMKERTIDDLLEGESSADVVLKTFCTRFDATKPDILYFEAIADGFGGHETFAHDLMETYRIIRYCERAIEFLRGVFKAKHPDGKNAEEAAVYIGFYRLSSEYYDRFRQLQENRVHNH